jgi:RNA polymerase sigma-70 factor, ECF subfamily
MSTMNLVTTQDFRTATETSDPAALARRFVTEAMPVHPELLRAARRYTTTAADADDLVQETYARAWSGFASFQQGSNLRAWMFRILYNTWVSTHRKTLSRPAELLTGDVGDRPAVTAAAAEVEALFQVVDPQLRCAVWALPQNLALVVYYAWVCELPLKHIAALTDVPVGTVMSRAHRARKILRKALIENTIRCHAA